MCPTSTVGYQFFLPQQGDAIDPVTGRFMLDLGLERGIGFGAHFIEVYAATVITRIGPSAYSGCSSFDPVMPRQRPVLPPREQSGTKAVISLMGAIAIDT